MKLEIEGMSCDGCVQAVQRVVRKVPGVVSAEANLAEKQLTVEGNPERAAVIAAVEKAGYKAR
jgi:Au+-exporting ATPase